MKFNSSYMQCIYRDPNEYRTLVETVIAKVLELQKTLNFHAIAFRGSSGAAMAYPVSVATGIPLICVRKPSDMGHGCPVEGSYEIDVKKYIIIDDFISSGDTMNAIIEAIEMKRGDYLIECVGIIMYNYDYNMPGYSHYKKIPITAIKKP